MAHARSIDLDKILILQPNYGGSVVQALNTLLERLGRGSGSSPPGPNNSGWKVALIIIVWVVATLCGALYVGRLFFALRVVSLMIIIGSAPLLSDQILPHSRVFRVVFETALITLSATLFAWIELGLAWAGRPALFTAMAVLALEIGGNLLDWYKKELLKRLAQWPDVLASLHSDASSMHRVFRRQQTTFLAIPLGFIGGLDVGLIANYSNRMTIRLCVMGILCFASLFLAYFLFQSIFKMCRDLFIPVSGVGVAEQNRNLDLAEGITSLRKLYLFDSLHNIVLLGVFAAILPGFFGHSTTPIHLLLLLLTVTVVFCQIPFAFGQWSLRRRILFPFRGSEGLEFGKKLNEVAPLVPPFEFLTSLVTSGAGPVIFYLLDETIKDRLKILIG